jgi:zinc transporter ZupT
MPHVALLTYYCVFILLASIAGGMIPVWFRLTHRGMEFAVSFVAGLMLGVGLLHMLPHSIADSLAADPNNISRSIAVPMWWILAGFLTMFFIERFFCYHHHDVPGEDHEHAITTSRPTTTSPGAAPRWASSSTACSTALPSRPPSPTVMATRRLPASARSSWSSFTSPSTR